MFKYRIENLIMEYYSLWYAEYSKLSPEDKKTLYNKMVARDIRAKVDIKETYSIVSSLIAIWKGYIQLYADIYVSHKFYLCADFDLKEASLEILKYDNFKTLIYLMFYIKENIEPVVIKSSLLSKS